MSALKQNPAVRRGERPFAPAYPAMEMMEGKIHNGLNG